MHTKLKTYQAQIHAFTLTISACAFMAMPASAVASGNSIDKVYHPYVMPMETEIELRSISQFDNQQHLDNQQKHRVGVGTSFLENVFTEIYLIGTNTPDEKFDIEAMEIEAKIQLTEQGEFDEDWGVLFEYEKGFNNSKNELATGLLMDKEIGRWVGALNIFLEYEWGDDIKSEFETSLASQLRYRYSRLIEPAIEFYQNQDTTALGPVIMGDIRFAQARKLHWETGIIFGLYSKTPDQTLRLLLEYEF